MPWLKAEVLIESRSTTRKREGDVSLKIAGLLWLEVLVDKIAQKHAVKQREVKEVFANPASERRLYGKK